MTSDIYGVKPTGFVRKPLSVTLAEIEAALVTEFGPDVIQSPQSPLGQINALFADLVTELWERHEDLYQSYDPDQAEGTRLETLARLRLIARGASDDATLRQTITNAGQARIDLQDITGALTSIEGVTYAKVFTNETGEVTDSALERGTVAVAVIGGADEDIATALRQYIAPGVNTYGNTLVSSEINGYCRSAYLIRPVEVPVTLTVDVRASADRFDCPPPSNVAIRAALVADWAARRINGLDVTWFTIRSLIESRFPNVEVLSFTALRDGVEQDVRQPLDIAFIEIAQITEELTTVNIQ